MKTVLVVDDSKVVRTMMTRHLHRYGSTVHEASNGAEALEAVRRHAPDLILLDLAMPVMDGRQCLVELRRDPGCAAIPVIALSTESSREIAVELARLGVTAALIKPFQQDTFDREVQKVLGAPGAPHDAAGLESLLQDCLGEDEGCTVFAVPASAVTAKILPLLAARLRGLAEEGADRLILDLTQLSDIGGDQVTSLARVLAEAGSLGIRTALCATSEPLRTKLEQIAETKDAPCTATREAARASLQ